LKLTGKNAQFIILKTKWKKTYYFSYWF
jgi:hypothetical protein